VQVENGGGVGGECIMFLNIYSLPYICHCLGSTDIGRRLGACQIPKVYEEAYAEGFLQRGVGNESVRCHGSGYFRWGTL